VSDEELDRQLSKLFSITVAPPEPIESADARPVVLESRSTAMIHPDDLQDATSPSAARVEKRGEKPVPSLSSLLTPTTQSGTINEHSEQTMVPASSAEVASLTANVLHPTPRRQVVKVTGLETTAMRAPKPQRVPSVGAGRSVGISFPSLLGAALASLIVTAFLGACVVKALRRQLSPHGTI
jgi:hypothetical protein